MARGDALATITLSGDIVGTARYMSPEQARGGRHQPDARTDIYSLGATLYELLALRPAYEGDSREAVLSQIAFSDPVPLRKLDPGIPRDLETIISKCMEKDPQRRYARAADVAEDCRRFLGGEPIMARRTPALLKTLRFVRKHRIATLAVAVVLALGATTVALAVQMRHVRGQRCLEEGANAILFEGDLQRGMCLLDEAATLGVDSAELYLYRGLIPLLSNQPQKAMRPLTQALQRDPDNVQVSYALALVYNAAGDIVNGRRVTEQTADREIPTALGWLLRGLSLSRLQRSEAIEAYDRAIALRSDFTPAIRARAQYRGTRLLVEGRRSELDPMLNDCDALVIFRPMSSRSCAARARGWLVAAAYATTQADLHSFREAWLANCETDLAQALALRREDDSFVLGQQGAYLRYIGDLRSSARVFAQALEVDRAAARDPDAAFVHEYAMVLYAIGDLHGALAAVEPLCASPSAYYSLLLQRALLLAELGRLDAARAVGRECMVRYRAHANGLFLSAAMLELLGDVRPIRHGGRVELPVDDPDQGRLFP